MGIEAVAAMIRGGAGVKWLHVRCLFMLIIYLFLLIHPSSASAHAYIIKSAPAENEILTESPKKVTIQFDETIQPSFNSIEVFDSSGKQVDQKNGRIDPSNPAIIESDLKEHLPDGTYRIQWRVVSSDGHPVEGVIPFQIGNGSAVDHSSLEQEATGYTPGLDLVIIRWLQYVSNACLVGILFFSLFVMNKPLVQDAVVRKIFRKRMKLSVILLSLSIVLSLPLQATIESGLPWSKVLQIQVLMDLLLYTRFGETWIFMMIGLFFLILFTYLLIKKWYKPVWICISFILGIGLLLVKAFNSHAASTTNLWISIPLDFIHLLSASIWIGSLLVLVSLIPLSRNMETKPLYLELIRRFSKWGISCVLLLTLSGLIGSFSFIPNLHTLLSTNYGRMLSGKVLLLAAMIVFAAINFVKGKRNRERGLTTSLWGELLTGLVIFILSVLLTNLPTAMASPGPFKDTKILQPEGKVTLEVTPNVMGKNTYVVLLQDPNGQPKKEIEQVTLTFTSLEMDMGTDTQIIKQANEGKYESTGMNFNMAGRWNVHVHVLMKDLETLDTDFKVFVGN